MSRLTDAILPAGTGPATTVQAPMIDLRMGGQQGFDLALDQWVSNQAYVPKSLICLLVEAPRGMQLLPNPDVQVGTLRSLVELQAQSITGLTATLEVELASTAIGGAGQVQEDFTNVTQAVSKPVFKWGEKYGMAVANYMYSWITNLIMDPHTKYPNVITLGANKPTDTLADLYAATMIFIEPDPTHTKVVKAWLCTNMYPTSSGEITSRRELSSASEVVTHDITFTAISQYGLGVNKFAQTLLDTISTVGANPQHRATFIDKIAADVLASKSSYENNVENLGSTSLKL
jgi:hypothetical protein